MPSSLDRVLNVLEAFSRDAPELGITELSASLRMPKSTIHRILAILERRGYVRQTAGAGKYRLGPMLCQLGAVAIDSLNLRDAARPYMEDLCRQTGETISLTILDGCDSLYVDEIPSRHPVRAHTYIGSRAPAHAVATGKAMICHHPGALQQLLAGELRRFTEHTIVDPVELERELKSVREHGYALNRGEWRPGVCAAAAAVRNHTALVAALGVSGPDSRLTRERLHQLGPLVRDAAARLSRDLGFVGAPGAAAS